MRDVGGEFLFVVGDHDEGLVGTAAEGVDDVAHEMSAIGVEAMQGFVEDEQRRILDEGTSQEAQTLFATRKGEEHAVAQVLDAEDAHPEETGRNLVGARTLVETYRIVQTACHNVDGGTVFLVGSVELGTDETDVLLDLPDGFARAATTTEERDVAGIGGRMVGTDETEQGGLARAIASLQCPMFAASYRPAESSIEHAVGVGQGQGEVADADDLVGRTAIDGEVGDRHHRKRSNLSLQFWRK